MDLSISTQTHRKFVSKYASNSKNTKKIGFCLWVLFLSSAFVLTGFSYLNFNKVTTTTNIKPEILNTQSEIDNIETFFTNEKVSNISAFTSSSVKTSLASGVETKDKMSLIIEQFLVNHNSNMKGLGSYIVSEGNRIGVDPSLFVAISGVESNFCKFVPYNPNGISTFNCHGWGRHGKLFNSYASWKDEITNVMTGFKKGYGGINVNVRSIQNIYCPDCSVSNNWSNGVLMFMNEIKQMYNAI